MGGTARGPLLRAAAIPVAAVAFIVAGAALRLWLASPKWGDKVWLAGLVLGGTPLVVRTLRSVVRGHFATDVVAMLAVVAAVILREPLAGLVVVLMQSGGEALERYAEGRASQAVRALERDAPRLAHRSSGGEVQDIPVEEIRVGDLLLVRPGEMVPCDSEVVMGESHVDTSRLTGEPIPVAVHPGARLMSGTLNGEGALTVKAIALARESQYARIVELVRSAETSKAPLQRLADRYAVWFTPITLLTCLVAWMGSGDPLRVLAVLVVATPCPLILATPIAIIGGIDRAASRQIIVRSGAALERLERVRVAVFDKTGTITVGRPRVVRIAGLGGQWSEAELLRLAAALEQQSGHPLARPVVDAAAERHIALPVPTAVVEAPGSGVLGVVEGHEVAVGSRSYIEALIAPAVIPVPPSPGLRAFVALDRLPAGMIEYADEIRAGVAELLRTLRELGVRRTLLLSGDHEENVRAVAQQIGVDEWVANLLPAEKVEYVARLSATAGRVLMVGDGTNDAPALSRADVGIAMAGHGGGITAEAADAVILVDDIARVAEAVRIGQRAIGIARQSIWFGLGLSATAMAFAALGYIPPALGAMLQEGIDVAVILNALRAASSGQQGGRAATSGVGRSPTGSSNIAALPGTAQSAP
jgi:heavy metal translocating P-type ATPase